MSFISNSISNNLPTSSNSASAQKNVQVEGNKISWPDDGWYEVQSADSFNTLSEGGRSASLPAGTYNLINHTTGERFENITVGGASVTTREFGPGAMPSHLDLVKDPDIPIFNLETGNFDRPNAWGVLAEIDDLISDINEGVLTSGPSDPSGPPAEPVTTSFNSPDGSETTIVTLPNGDSTTVVTNEAAGTVTITNSTVDTDDPNSPITNVSTTYDLENGEVISTELTVTSPSGGTTGPAGTNGQEDGGSSEPNEPNISESTLPDGGTSFTTTQDNGDSTTIDHNADGTITITNSSPIPGSPNSLVANESITYSSDGSEIISSVTTVTAPAEAEDDAPANQDGLSDEDDFNVNNQPNIAPETNSPGHPGNSANPSNSGSNGSGSSSGSNEDNAPANQDGLSDETDFSSNTGTNTNTGTNSNMAPETNSPGHPSNR